MPTPSFSLKSLTLRAFRSIVDEQTIQLPQTGMNLIVGSSGSGKTTLGEGIAFALGYSNISAVALQSWEWLTEEHLKAVLEVETAKGLLRITRGKGANVLMPGEEKPRTSAKAVAEGVERALGINPEFLKALVYRGQKSPGLFLGMTDSGKKSFLTQLLGLDRFEKVTEKSQAAISALQAEAERAKIRHQTLLTTVPGEVPLSSFHVHDISAWESKVAVVVNEYVQMTLLLEETKALDLGLTTKQARVVEAVKAEWRPKVVAAEVAVQSVPKVDATRQELELSSLRSDMTAMSLKHRVEVVALEKEAESAKQLLYAMNTLANKRSEAEMKLSRDEKRLLSLQDKKCFTCQQTWLDISLTNAVAQCKTDIESHQKVVSEAVQAAERVIGLAEKTANLQKQVTALRAVDHVPPEVRAEVEHLVGLIASAKSQREVAVANAKAEFHRITSEADRAVAAASRMTPEEEQVRRTLSDLQSALSSLSSKVATAKQAVVSATRENEMSLKQFNEDALRREASLTTVAKAAKELAAAERALGTEQDFLAMVRGFLSYLFDETLARIADATNARLALIPNVSNITLRFDSERETGTGKLRQEIVAVCEKGGHVIPIKDGISGGMFSVVELAVDLSLADVIAERTGVFAGWLILDECFEGLDSEAKVATFDMLKATSQDRAIFVIDHASEMKEMFDSRIVASFDGERSTISTNK